MHPIHPIHPIREATILVVDDNPTNLHLLLETLNEAGYRALISPDGERALRQVERFPPDLILLDVMMPGIDGFETCRRLRKDPRTREIPVIFMTALTKTSDKVRGFESGAVDYITKPFQQEEVLSRIRTHLTLRRQRRELAEINAAKDRFFSIVAHDMRGAFNSLFAYADILAEQLRDTSDPGLLRTSKGMSRCVEDTYRLLDNLLQWALLQQEKMEFEPRETDLRALTDDILIQTGGHREKKGIAAENAVSARTRVWADPRMLHTILRNIVVNAIKFTPSGGRIEIRAEDAGDRHRVSVADTGIGIEPENLDKLFRVDEKHRKDGTDGESGTGLGLALCRELVERNDGEIHIESRLGEGTVVRITLPKSEPANGGFPTPV